MVMYDVEDDDDAADAYDEDFDDECYDVDGQRMMYGDGRWMMDDGG